MTRMEKHENRNRKKKVDSKNFNVRYKLIKKENTEKKRYILAV